MEFASLLDSFRGTRALIVGDVMLDEYVFGTVDRISPEAPVMVVKKMDSRWVPGGAANVGKNIAAMGGVAHVIGLTGTDSGGEALRASMSEHRLEHSLIAVEGRPTTRKTRIVANHAHQVLRIDEEVDDELTSEAEEHILAEFSTQLPNTDLVILSDYRKGLLTQSLVRQVIEKSTLAGKPVFANAKPESARFYKDCTLVSLNRAETTSLIGSRPGSLECGLEASNSLRETLGVESVLVTLGELGMSASWLGGSSMIAAPEIEAYDVAGAGDTVLATVALGVQARGFTDKVFILAAETSARVVRHVGVAVPSPIDLAEIRSRA